MKPIMIGKVALSWLPYARDTRSLVRHPTGTYEVAVRRISKDSLCPPFSNDDAQVLAADLDDRIRGMELRIKRAEIDIDQLKLQLTNTWGRLGVLENSPVKKSCRARKVS